MKVITLSSLFSFLLLILESDAITADVEVAQPQCSDNGNDGVINIVPTGSSPSLFSVCLIIKSFLIIIVNNDKIKIDRGVNNQGSPTFNNLADGTYMVTASDSSGCRRVLQTVTISHPTRIILFFFFIIIMVLFFNLSQYLALTLYYSVARSACYNTATGGSIKVMATGGVPPYYFSVVVC